MDKNYILHKYLNGEASAEEIQILRSSPEYASYVEISEAALGFEAPQFDSAGTYQAILSKRDTQVSVKKLNPVKTLLKIAAVVAVICAGYLYLNTLDTTVSTGIAQKESIVLPDASEVLLNADSQLSYNKSDWKRERSLSLSGEAYFKVSKGSTFSVNTSQGVVTVLGTQFNVFSRDSLFHVQCYEGLVSVAYNDTLIKLPAGNKLKVENGTLVVHTPTNATAPVWITDESHFENMPVGVILQEIERYYPVKVNAAKIDLSQRFTGSFTHSDLELALKSVCEPLQLQYTVTNGEVLIYAQGSQ
ncbi:FecR domain-containing protein [Altibacter sp.]|uniref:FecR family protein n=1 Tax=Altibacter sp. TaxID=2024823 RepID=UPI000C972220|nr:FecR domain-containing protein [Altibacter sp.]MAP55463.1 histidine kinase [Altibacter sp.]